VLFRSVVLYAVATKSIGVLFGVYIFFVNAWQKMEKTAWLLGLFKKSSRKKSIFSQKNIDFFESHTYNIIEKPAKALAKLPAEEGFAMGTIQEQLANVEPRERFRQMMRNLRVEYEKRGLPLRGRFELTPHCSLDCKMCYVHRSDGEYPHRVLTGDEWINIMDQAINMGMLCATLTGGECMLHPDFKRIYLYLKKRGVYVSILSNGTLIDEDMVDFLEQYPPNLLQISVYGNSPEMYDRVAGVPEAFGKVDKALRLLKEKRIMTGISLTLSKYNAASFEDLWNYSCKMTSGTVSMDCELFEPVESSGHHFSEYALSFDERKFLYIKEAELKGGLVSALCEADILDEPVQPVQGYTVGLPCAAGLSLFFVSYYGMMMPCNNFPLACVNLLENSVCFAWEQINQRAKMFERSEECKTCAFLGRCAFCAARFAIETGGKNGLPGEGSCDKKSRLLRRFVYQRVQMSD